MTADVPTTRAISDEAVREHMIVTAANAMHECVSHPDYPDYDEAPCCGTPGPAMGNGDAVEFHRDMGHERGSRGVCWSCEPLAAAAVDALLAQSSGRGADHALGEKIAQAIEAHLISIESDWQDGMRYAAAIARTFADEVTGR